MSAFFRELAPTILILSIAFMPTCSYGDDFGRSMPEEVRRYVGQIHLNGSTGTGIIFGTTNWLYLVTAKHVILDPKNGLFRSDSLRFDFHCLHRPDEKEKKANFDVPISSSLINSTIYFSSGDLAVLRLGRMKDGWESAGTVKVNGINGCTIYSELDKNAVLFEDVKLTSEIIFFGYPSSLASTRQLDLSFPLFRRGIVAGKNEDARTIVIDGAVYGGNSGGPVYVITQPHLGSKQPRLIGIASEFVPEISVSRNERNFATGATIQNSGYSIVEPVDQVLELIHAAEKGLAGSPE